MDLQNFHVTFAIGIVETPLHTTIKEYGLNERSFLLGKATAMGPFNRPEQNIDATVAHKIGPF